MTSGTPNDPGEAGRRVRLVEEARRGSPDALGRLLELFRPDVLGFVRADRAGQPSRAGGADLVEQTLLAAGQGLGHFEGTTDTELAAWLRAVFDRTAAASGEPDAGTGAAPGEQAEAVERAVARLPEAYRQVIDLHNRRHLTFAEIAPVVGRSPEAVRRLWARAVEKLQRELGLS
ncbi:RNA polymerase sigma factor [Gemmata sp.]|uniref:RNA polymerase sigma factor n=1 Tax=Gemmata sp. TaxID=1914242 RepID=UPI003F6EB832